MTHRLPHQIKITITPEGEIVGEVRGVRGRACASLSAWLDQLGEVVEDRHTPDYHKQQPVVRQATLTGG